MDDAHKVLERHSGSIEGLDLGDGEEHLDPAMHVLARSSAAKSELLRCYHSVVNTRVVELMEHGLEEGRVKGEVGDIDTSDIRVDDLDAALALAESNQAPCPAHTKVLIYRARTTNMLRHTILRDGWEGAVALIFGKPDILAPMIGR